MVKCVYDGRMGNNMFQYSFSRLIAIRKNYKLIADPIPYFKKTYEQVDGNIVEPLTRMSFYQKVNFKQIDNCNTGILLTGYFQIYNYYKDYVEEIKKWFTLENEDLYEFPKPNDLIIHLRLGDYVHLGLDLPFEYVWGKAREIKKTKNLENIYVVTTDPHHNTSIRLEKEGCILYNKSEIQDFLFLKNSKHLMISQSSYSWWAAFLGNSEVYFPTIKLGDGHWGKDKEDSPDLCVDDKRFNYF